MKKLIPLLCLVLAAFPFTVHSDDAKARQLLKQANEAAEKYIKDKGTFEETVRLYKTAIVESSEDPAICMEFVKKSIELLKYGLVPEKNMENAVTYYRKAAARGVRDTEVMRNIGDGYILCLYNDSGFKWLRESIDLAENKMKAAQKSGNTGDAARYRKEQLAGYDSLAWGHKRFGEFEKALDLLTELEKKFPDLKKGQHLTIYAENHLWLAMKALGDGDYSAAGKHLDMSEELATRAGSIDALGPHIHYYQKLLRECTAVKSKKPAYTQRLLILYVGKGRMRRIVPQTIPSNQFEGFIKEKLGNYDFGILKQCYTLNSQRSVYELSKKGMEGLIPLAGKNIEESILSRYLGSVLYRDTAKAEYYPEQEMSEAEFRLTKIYVNLLGRQVQAMSRGKLALQFRHEYLKDAAMTGYAPGYGIGCAADYKKILPYPSELIFESINDIDGIFMINANKMSPNNGYGVVAYGGTNSIPIIPYILDSPSRCMIRISNEQTRDVFGRKFFHEYFHTVENLWDLPTHAQNNSSNHFLYRNLDGSDNHLELDYFRWQLGTKIPKQIEEMLAKGDNSGWEHFSWAKRRPMRLSKEAFANLLKKSEGVSLEDRRDALDCMARAKLAREKKNKELEDQLYRQALKLNPACFDAYFQIANRALEEKNYREAVENYAEYLKYTDSPHYTSKTGCILIANLDDYTQGMKYADMAIERENDAKNKVRWCREIGNAFWAKKKYVDAARYYERGASLNFGRDSLECLFFEGEALYANGDRDKGKSFMQSAYEKGLKGTKKYDDKMKKYK